MRMTENANVFVCMCVVLENVFNIERNMDQHRGKTWEYIPTNPSDSLRAQKLITILNTELRSELFLCEYSPPLISVNWCRVNE